jgi:hypothetical protein
MSNPGRPECLCIRSCLCLATMTAEVLYYHSKTLLTIPLLVYSQISQAVCATLYYIIYSLLRSRH